MGQINWGRVIGGGLLAGLVMNVSEYLLHGVVLNAEGKASMDEWNRLGLHVSDSPHYLMILVGITFVLGILALWTYAAIRPRFGPGPRTALVAGTAMWFFAYVWGYLGVRPYQIFSDRTLLLAAIWGLAEINLTALLGAWLYRE